MDPNVLTAGLFLAALLVFFAELLLPSHGLLTLGGLTLLVMAIVRLFEVSATAGVASVVASVIGVPAIFLVGIRHVHRLPFGGRVAPPNPTAVVDEGVRELEHYVGMDGLAMSSLRPGGACDFGGRRIQCVAEGDFIDAEAAVEAVGVRSRTLVVRPKSA